jgi:ribose-phosphate pyrophosphokinase
MKTLSLIASNNDVQISKFAGGENHVRILCEILPSEQVQIITRINSADDLMNLCLAVDALERMGIRHIEAYIPYLPYARQDRVMSPGEPLSIKVFATMINALNLQKVTIFDAHSDVTPALLDRCVNQPNYLMIDAFLDRLSLTDFTLVSPDLGAYKKIDKLAQHIGYKGEIATGIKVRNLETGQIIKSDVNVSDLHGKTCVVIDDICDGGRTFIELAAALKNKGAGDLYFFASHGIFSHNALERLKEAGYKKVGSSNSISEREEDEFYMTYYLF